MPNARGEYSESERRAMQFNLYGNPFRPQPEPTQPQVTPPPSVDPLKAKNDEMMANIQKEIEADTLRKLEEQKLQRQREFDERLMKEIESSIK